MIYKASGCLLAALLCCQLSSAKKSKTLVIGGLFPMSGGWAGGIGCLPAVQLALDDVNSQYSILSDYKLDLVSIDSKCLPGYSLSKLYELLYSNQTKLILMTGCSSVSTFVAQAAKMWNLVVLSYGSSSPALSNRERFPTFFRTHPSATLDNPARVKLFHRFHWRKIATVQQTEEVFTSTIKDFEELIRRESLTERGRGLEVTVRQSFQADPTNAIKSLKRQDARIIVGVFYEDMARKVFCQAYKEGLYGKRYVWLIIGWYPDNWFKKVDPNIDCTAAQLQEALEGHLTTEVVQYNLNTSVITDTNITTDAFIERLKSKLSNLTLVDKSSLTQLAGFVEAPLAYDAIWALSFAFEKARKTLELIGKNLEDFNYQDDDIKDAIISSLERTDFEGVSGRVTFTSTGDRIAKTQIEQMHDGNYSVIGYYNYMNDELDWRGGEKWMGGNPPPDQTIKMGQLRVIFPMLVYVMAALAGLGVILCAAALLFAVCSRNYSLLSNSMPVLNVIIAVGCLVMLSSVPLFGLDGRLITTEQYTILCQLRAWIVCFGFTLSYGVMFVKVFHSWRITKASREGSKTLNRSLYLDGEAVSSWEPYIVLLAMLVLDGVLMGCWQGIDPMSRSLKTFPVIPPSEDEERDIAYEPQLEQCTCVHRSLWMGLIYGYKGCLLMVGLFLAYDVRSIKIRCVNDLKFIAMAVYNVVVLCLIAVPVTLIIPNQENASFVFVSVAVILSCYLTVALVFGPKVITICRRRIDMDEDETQRSLMQHETSKRYDQLKSRNEELKREIAQKEKRISELQASLRLNAKVQVTEESRASDSAFSEDGSNQERIDSYELS